MCSESYVEILTNFEEKLGHKKDLFQQDNGPINKSTNTRNLWAVMKDYVDSNNLFSEISK